MDAPSLLAGLVIGSGLGSIAGALFASGRAQERIDTLEMQAAADDQLIRKLGRVIIKYKTDESRRLAPLRAANAARKQAKIDRDNEASALKNARHAEMRELVGGLI